MIPSVSGTLIVVVCIFFCFGFTCLSMLFCCCCALSSSHLCGAFLCCAGWSSIFSRQTRRKKYSDNYGSRNSAGTHSFNGVSSEAEVDSARENEVMIAEAFLVAPLAEARIVKDNYTTQNAIEQANGIGQESATVTNQQPLMIFKDMWAAVLFILQCIVIISLAINVVLKSLLVSDNDNTDENGLVTIILACGVLGLLATIMGTICLNLILRNADFIIEGVLWVNIAVCSFGAVLCLASGGAFAFAIILAIAAALSYWYLISVASRIAFASAVLSVACRAIKDNYVGVLFSAYFLLVAQLGWFILWAAASYGVGITFIKDGNDSRPSNDDYDNVELSGGQVSIAILLLLSLHWGSEVMRSLLQTTVNGVIACWWFQPERKAVVRGALFRSMTTSFGSVCLGSFVVSVIHTLRDILRMVSNKDEGTSRRERGGGGNAVAAKMLECILGLIEGALMYFNKYAYCYVAGYGMGFIESARKVTTLFSQKGLTAIVNDNLVGNALNFALFGMTVITALMGYFSTLFLGPQLLAVGITDPSILLSIIGAMMGFAVGSVLTSALTSGVAMVFVCMAEDPESLKSHHLKEYMSLTAAWDEFNPNNSWSTPAVLTDFQRTSNSQAYPQHGQIPPTQPFNHQGHDNLGTPYVFASEYRENGSIHVGSEQGEVAYPHSQGYTVQPIVSPTSPYCDHHQQQQQQQQQQQFNYPQQQYQQPGRGYYPRQQQQDQHQPQYQQQQQQQRPHHGYQYPQQKQHHGEHNQVPQSYQAGSGSQYNPLNQGPQSNHDHATYLQPPLQMPYDQNQNQFRNQQYQSPHSHPCISPHDTVGDPRTAPSAPSAPPSSMY